MPASPPPVSAAVASADARTPMGEVIIRFSHVKKRFGPKVIFTDLTRDALWEMPGETIETTDYYRP